MVKILAGVAGATLLLASMQADALDVLSTQGTGAAGNCQAALPAYEGVIRKRPLALANEGDTAAFVTCALTTEEVSLNVQSFRTDVRNLSNVPVTISCTAVIGEDAGSADYVVKSINLAPLASGTLSWTGLDAGGLVLADSVALSCNLPPLTALNRNRITTLLSLI
ncbi:hypothetical protein ACW5F0_09050 [Luteimonas sp. A534]